MSDAKTGKKGNVEGDNDTRPDLEGEEFRGGSFYKPISTPEYFKLLGYCVFGLVVVGLTFALFVRFTG